MAFFIFIYIIQIAERENNLSLPAFLTLRYATRT